MSPLQKEFKTLKEKHPETVIWFYIGGHYQAHKKDAVATALYTRNTLTFREGGYPIVVFDKDQFKENVKIMSRKGFKMLVVTTKVANK